MLAYHNIVPDGESPAGDQSLHLPVATFRRQLDIMERTHDIVPLSTLLEGRRGARPAVAITFDDAYRGALTAGLEALAERGLPASFFVVPGFLGRGFWWDEVPADDAPERAGDFREDALNQLAGRDGAIREWAAKLGMVPRVAPGHAQCATLEELAEAVHAGNVTLAAHSWSHANLARVEPADLEQELRRPLDWLREHFAADRVLPFLAFPYGRSSAQACRAAQAAGYAAAFSVTSGWLPPQPAGRYDLPRLNVPNGLSIEGFGLRIAGLI